MEKTENIAVLLETKGFLFSLEVNSRPVFMALLQFAIRSLSVENFPLVDIKQGIDFNIWLP